MDNEYKLEVIMTPHLHDNAKEPHFWCIYHYSGTGWHNVVCGWAATPDKAFEAAKKEYDRITSDAG